MIRAPAWVVAQLGFRPRLMSLKQRRRFRKDVARAKREAHAICRYWRGHHGRWMYEAGKASDAALDLAQ